MFLDTRRAAGMYAMNIIITECQSVTFCEGRINLIKSGTISLSTPHAPSQRGAAAPGYVTSRGRTDTMTHRGLEDGKQTAPAVCPELFKGEGGGGVAFGYWPRSENEILSAVDG